MTWARRAILLVQEFWLVAALLAAWQIFSANHWVNPFFFPPPARVLRAAWEMTRNGELARELVATLGRYGWGALFGCAAGLLAGVVMGAAETARRAFEPILAALYSTPKITLLPLVMLIFGIGDASKIVLVATVTFIYLARQTVDAIRGIDRTYIEIARNYRADTLAIVRRVYVPAALPQIFTGLRIALTRSLVTAIALELVSGKDGVGAMIWLAWQTLATERLYVGILLAALLGVIIHRVLGYFETLIVPWHGGGRR